MTDFLFDISLGIEAPKPKPPEPANVEYLVVGGDSSEIISYVIGGNELLEVSRINLSPYDRVLSLIFSEDGKKIWGTAVQTGDPDNRVYLFSIKFAAGVMSGLTVHLNFGPAIVLGFVNMSFRKTLLAIRLGAYGALYLYETKTGIPSFVDNALFQASALDEHITFCGAIDQYVAFTRRASADLILVDPENLTDQGALDPLDTYFNRSAGLAAHRGTDIIFAKNSSGNMDALSVNGGTLTQIAAAPDAGTGNLVYLPGRGELWSGEYYVPWDGSAFGARVQTPIGANRIIAASPSEERIAAVSSNGVELYQIGSSVTLVDSLTAAQSLSGRALATTGPAKSSDDELRPAPPVIDAIDPSQGPASGGTQVIIRGARFQDGVQVVFGINQAFGINRISQIKIKATTPPGTAGPVDVIVRNPDGQEAILEDGFIYT